jgi:hypothetical protein
LLIDIATVAVLPEIDVPPEALSPLTHFRPVTDIETLPSMYMNL